MRLRGDGRRALPDSLPTVAESGDAVCKGDTPGSEPWPGGLRDLVSLTTPAQTPRQTKRKNASRPRQSTTPRLTYWIDKMVALLLIEVFEMADPGQTPSACKDFQ